MARQLAELESVLHQLIAEHRKLHAQLEVQQTAMKAMDLTAMDNALRLQEATRLRIAALDTRRKAVVADLGRTLRIPGELTVRRIAELFPAQGPAFLKMKDELKAVIDQIGQRTNIAGRLAGAVLGHLNTVVRLLAGAVEQAGLYTKHGVPQVASRIGVMDAVG